MNKDKALYIIPARGGSKGIPGKNIKPLGGKPLIAYAIEAARGAGAPDSRIIVSTDDGRIAAVARDWASRPTICVPRLSAATPSAAGR